MTFAKIGAVALVASVALAGAAHAEDGKTPGGMYISGGGGFVWADELSAGTSSLDFDGGYAVQVAVGYDTGDMNDLGKIRTDLELFYSESDNDTFTTGGVSTAVGGSLDQIGLLANVYVDMMPGSVIRPYLGVGAGVVRSDLSISVGGATVSADGTDFAYRLAGGAFYQITDTLAFDVGYRYLAVDTDSETTTHSVLGSFRYAF